MTREEVLAKIQEALSSESDEGVRPSRILVQLGDESAEHEFVSFVLDGGALRIIASDPAREDELVAGALRAWGASGLEGGAGLEHDVKGRGTGGTVVAGDELGEALAEVVTAVARLGTRKAADAPSLNAALSRVLEAAPEPLPVGLRRFIGRLAYSLDHQDAGTQASVLLGASRLVEVLGGQPGEDGDRLLCTWLEPERVMSRRRQELHARHLVELGRERVTGVTRHGVERRYLIDLSDGELYKEEYLRSDPRASVGPCPRRINLDLGETFGAGLPPRIRLLQYRVSLNVPSPILREIESFAEASVVGLREGFVSNLRLLPALGEPVALVSPVEITDHIITADGGRLPLASRSRHGDEERLRQLASSDPVRWVFGRLVDEAGRLSLAALSVCVGAPGAETFHRLA